MNPQQLIEKTCLMSCIMVAAFILFACLAITSYILGPVSAQITPSLTSTSTPDSLTSPQSSVMPESLPSLDSEIRPVAQDTADLQNSTTTNITQLATISSTTTNQPIVPASLAPVSTESNVDSGDYDDSGDGSSGDDSNDDDNGDDDSGDDGDGDGGDSVAIAGGGGAFASAG